MNILYINLDKDIKRKQHIENELNKYKLSYTRISGITCNKKFIKNIKQQPVIGNLNNINFKFDGRIKKYSTLGCFLAHLHAIIHIKNNLIGNTMILEDDMDFTLINDFNNQINEIIKNAPPKWNVLKLHCSNSFQIKNLYNKWLNGEHYSPVTEDNIIISPSAGCYIFSENGIKKFYDMFYNKDENRWDIKNNYILSDVVMFSVGNVYSYNFPLFLNYITPSNNYNNNINLYEIKSNKTILDITYK